MSIMETNLRREFKYLLLSLTFPPLAHSTGILSESPKLQQQVVERYFDLMVMVVEVVVVIVMTMVVVMRVLTSRI